MSTHSSARPCLALARAIAGCVSVLLVCCSACAPSPPPLRADEKDEAAAGTDRAHRSQNARLGALIGAAQAADSAPAGYGLSGAGVQAGVWDEGHARSSHVDLRGRVHARDLGGLGMHATHTTATLAGSGAGDAEARGIATAVHVWAHDWVLDMIEMEAAAAGLSVSSNAYGPTLGWSRADACPDRAMWWGGGHAREDPAFGRYGREAAGADALVHRTDLPVVWPAGNERLDAGARAGEPHYHAGSCTALFDDVHLHELTLQFGLLGGAAVAKNVITVGAARAVARDALDAERIVPLDVSGFGPTDDGRIKPDLLAGGDAVRSASVVGDDAYAVLAGTSSATAATAGAIALLTELYRDTHGGVDPRAPEIKALLVQTAHDAGPEPGPDYGTGYGLLDASAAAALIARDGAAPSGARHLWVAVSDGSTFTLTTADPVPADTALRVTLAWTDPPSQIAAGDDGAASALVNDLDLVVTREADGEETRLYAWSLDAAAPSAPATRAAPNRADNVEVVDVSEDEAGGASFRVEVEPARPLWRAGPQAFAIVSSVPLVAQEASAGQPALAVPRYAVVETPPDELPQPLHVAIENRGGGVLGFRASSLTPWLAVSPAQGEAPDEIVIEIDAVLLASDAVDEAFGRVRIESDDPAGARLLGVIWRAACEPACEDRSCGPDPRCGASCGRCAPGQACAGGGRCVDWAAGCPSADLGSELGAALVSGDSRDASGIETGSCGGATASDSSFTWTAPESGRYAFTTRGSEHDTVLYVQDASCGSAELACSDDSGAVTSALALELAAGAQVTAVVDAFDVRSAGTFRLNVERAVCPVADLGTRIGPGIARASTAGGIDELAGSCGGEGSEDVALAWTAPAAGRYRFALFDPRFQAVLYLRAGDCDGAELGCSAAADVGPVEVELERGETVVVVVDGREAQRGDFTLDVLALGASCAGACGGPAAGAMCSCDAACIAASDCCADACASCGHCRCQPSCTGRECGDDGCGGSCGDCGAGEACADGRCAEDGCGGVECEPCSVCADGRCRALPEDAACEDGDPCTVLDACRDGVCAGEPRACDDGFECTQDRCDARSGACEYSLDRGCCELDACADGGCLPADPRCPAGDIDDAGPPQVDAGSESDAAHGDGCGCRVVGAGSASRGPAASLLLLLLAFSWRRRRRDCQARTHR
jgi:hypothetical protein